MNKECQLDHCKNEALWRYQYTDGSLFEKDQSDGWNYVCQDHYDKFVAPRNNNIKISENLRSLESSEKPCSQCYSGLSGSSGWKQIGPYKICGNCYDKFVFEIAEEWGVQQTILERLELKEAIKKWDKFYNE